MNAADAYEHWAPPGCVWSVWAKPVVFTLLDDRPSAPEEGPADDAGDGAGYDVAQGVRWAPAPEERVALVIDLPGPDAVAAGLALASRGYRPVPLFNGCHGRPAAIDVLSIVRSLVRGIPELARCRIADDAPPAFLLDSRRDRSAPNPGCFDNRWVVLPQDFPSATFLASRGIRRAIVVDHGRTAPREDLAHVLLRWQEAGVEVRMVDHAASRPTPRPILVQQPSRFRSALHVLLALSGLRRSSAGGFGALVPVPPPPGSGGGFG